MKPSLLASACSLALALAGAAAAAPPADPIASATSAAPATIGRGATVMSLDVKVLRGQPARYLWFLHRALQGGVQGS